MTFDIRELAEPIPFSWLTEALNDNLFQYYTSFISPVVSSRERLMKKSQYIEPKSSAKSNKHTEAEMVPLRQLSVDRSDDTGESSCVENWLETSSKYHSCEIVED